MTTSVAAAVAWCRHSASQISERTMISSPLSLHARHCLKSFSDDPEDKHRFMLERIAELTPEHSSLSDFVSTQDKQGLNFRETHDVSSGIVVSCSHWITVLHLANVISISKKTFVLLPLFLHYSYLTYSAVSNDNFFGSFPQPILWPS